MKLSDFLGKLKDTHQLSDGSFQAKCPAHDDKQASLNITEGKEGKIVLHCYAGCSVKDIVNRLELTMSDLFQDGNIPKDGSSNLNYIYRNKENKPYLRVVKMPPKKFYIEHWDDVKNQWMKGFGGKKRILYRLPDLLDPDLHSEPVLWVEGEKDANRLEKLGLLSTTTPTGAASKLEGIDFSALGGREVIIIPDNDEPGKQYADKVKATLTGIAAKVKIVELPGLEEKQDISDWLDKGHTIDELWKIKAHSSYGEIIHISSVIEDIEQDIKTRASGKKLLRGIPTGLKGLDSKLSANGIPCGKITIFAGATSSGKSALANTAILSALKNQHKVLCIALEDEPKCVAVRMLSTLSSIQNRQLQQAQVFSDQQQKFEAAKQHLMNTSLYFKEDALSISNLTEEIKAFVADNGIELVVVDFLQLIPAGIRFGKKQEEVDYVFGELVSMARHMKDTATLVVSQLRRTGNEAPTKEALYHSGALEQWSHTIGLLWRPNISGFENCCAFLLDKQKNGPTGFITLGWHADTVSYHDVNEETDRLFQEAIAKM